MAADPLVELRGLHGPPVDLGTLLADGAIALAIGLLLAWGIVQVAALFTARRISPERVALGRLAALEGRADDEGLTARARLLQDLGAALPDTGGDWLARVDRHLDGFLSHGAGKGLRDALYRPGAGMDLARFDSDLKARLLRVGR